ncbi:tetratricopeptide repeat protein [Paraburkholderia sp. BCC1885]|uniref:tetratricopeptide repeat protein n=1 Tax=Paraburkholderia sp. BCC1885 TaxID=2562669 RepID=UPI0011820DCB|nr:tetratricopeptide repeat protein [Paraburkholderia sp. BCC1885]
MDVEHSEGAEGGQTVAHAVAERGSRFGSGSSTASLSRAREWHLQGRFDDAAREYEAVLAREPDRADVLQLYGVVQYHRGLPAVAETLLRRAVSLAPGPMVLTDLGALLAGTGRPDEALKEFEAALRIDPRHVQTLVALANTQLEMGRFEDALRAYDRALDVSPQALDALTNRGSALRALRRYMEALETYDGALSVDPHSFVAYYNRGHVLRELGRHAEALHSYDRALAIQPGNPAMLSARGQTLVDVGRLNEALASFNEAVASQPDFVEALYNSAVALERLRRPSEAIGRCERVLALESQHTRAMACRGNALLQLKQYDAALSSYGGALQIDAGSVEILCNQGTALRYLGQYEEALQSYDAALAINSGFAEAWGNRGNVLLDLHRHEEAMNAIDRAMAIRPDHPMYWFNRGNVLHAMARPDAALQAYDRAITLDPGYAGAHFARASLHLVQGDFTRGWAEYEWRIQDPGGEQRGRVFKEPLWQGHESLDGRTILVHAEQGFGDTLQFSRYAELLRARGANVVLEVQPALGSLMASLRSVVQVVVAGEPLPQFDFHCPLLSLPFAFQTDLHSIPNQTPYLYSDAALVERWEALLGPKQRRRVGLAWSGNPAHLNDRHRSIPLSTLMPLLEMDVEWISLQKGVREQDLAVLDGSPIRSFGDEIRDFSDTAALVQLLDLVISVDTSAAHLAGALNRPVWVLLPEPPEWRWMRDREDSPWYPSARLFRQSTPGDWRGVVDKVRTAIGNLV